MSETVVPFPGTPKPDPIEAAITDLGFNLSLQHEVVMDLPPSDNRKELAHLTTKLTAIYHALVVLLKPSEV